METSPLKVTVELTVHTASVVSDLISPPEMTAVVLLTKMGT